MQKWITVVRLCGLWPGLLLAQAPGALQGSFASPINIRSMPPASGCKNSEGDGVRDDTQAITCALDFAGQVASGAPAETGTVCVYVPPGTYRFSETLDIKAPICIMGVPGGTSTLLYSGSGTALIWEHAIISGGTQVTQYPYGPGLRDITLRGPGAASQTTGLLCGNNNRTASAQGAAFWNLKIIQFRIAFRGSNGCNLISALNTIFVNDSINLYMPAGASEAGEGIGFEHCTFANPAKTSANVVIGHGGWEMTFTRCSFDGGALVDSSTTTVTCQACHFENNANALNYDMLTIQNGFFACVSCLFSNDDPAAMDSQFIQVNGPNAVLLAMNTQFANPANASFPARGIEVSLAKSVTLIGSVLNHTSLLQEWALGPAQATFGVQSFGAVNVATPFGGRSTVGLSAELKYGRIVNVDASRGNVFTLAVTDRAEFTLTVPAHPPSGSTQSITFDIYNNSGGSMGAVTWPAGKNGYRLAGAFIPPANGFHRTISFQFNAHNGNWYEIARAGADMAN